MQRTPPYDTGKLKIGCHYEPRHSMPMSRDMELLQTALLRYRGPRIDIDMRRVLELTSYAVSVLIALLILFILYLPKST